MPSCHSLLISLSLSLSALSHSTHNHYSRHTVPGTWYQPREHPVHRLLKRGVGPDGLQYPEVGSPEWSAKYPAEQATSQEMPPEWLAALKAAEKAGKIPNIPPTTIVYGEDGTPDPRYPPGVDGLSPEVCSTTQKCRTGKAIYDGPDGTFATSFDDGPTEFTPQLLEFLKSQNEKATHFVIGRNMLVYVDQLKQMLASGNDLAVHTYNHVPLTNLSNADVVAQLAWTMQIIHDSTGGLVPKYLRPPYGDSDNRVDAIAREVLGLTVVIWNRETNDWGLPSGATKPADFQGNYIEWALGPKNPGLIVLDHETSREAVEEFAKAFPRIKENGWRTGSLGSILGGDPYQNVKNGKVNVANILKANSTTIPTPSATDAGKTSSSTNSIKETPTAKPPNAAANPTPSNSAALSQFPSLTSSLAIMAISVLFSTS